MFANEKGGTGKSTTAVHVAIALAAKGAKVACIDLDHRQRTLGRYLDNREATARTKGIDLPTPAHATGDGRADGNFAELFQRFMGAHEFLVIDTPGRDDPYARMAAVRADTLVANPSGYIASTGGSQTTSQPASVSIAMSDSSLRG